MNNIISLSANELVEKLKSGEISCVEACKAYIDRVNKFEKDVKAWAYIDKKTIIEKAIEKDEYRKSGKPLGPLHGLPIGVKDIIGTEDMPTECGTVLRKGMPESSDAEVVNLLKISGAIIMGKTVTTELAYFDPGKTTNPHDKSRTPGGSSSGSAAAVAAFMTPLSVGSQTKGSTIRPASYCGVVGYKPSFGLISRNGVLKQSSRLDQIGVFGKTVLDVALLAKSLINKPKLLFLDEPTASLDPDIGDFVREYLEKYKNKNELTMLLASHNMGEVERLCNKIIMMKQGTIVDEGTCSELIDKHGRENLEDTFLKIARSKDELA